MGKPLSVNIHQKKADRGAIQTPIVITNLFVKNLESGTTDAQLMEMFKPFGEILTVKVQQGKENQATDYGYVNFKRPEDAEQAIKEMNKKKVGNGVLIVNHHISKANNMLQTGT